MALDSDTLAQFLDALDRFVKERLIPNEALVAEEDAIPPALVQEIREMGLFGMSIPEEYGGLGLSMSEEVQAAFVLGQTSPVFRSLVGTNNGIGSQGIIIDGTAEQKAKYLPALASGEMIASFALTEPDAGSDAGSLRTTARRDAGVATSPLPWRLDASDGAIYAADGTCVCVLGNAHRDVTATDEANGRAIVAAANTLGGRHV